MICSRNISDEDYERIRKDLVQRKSAILNAPKFRLKFFGEQASLLTHVRKRQPLMFEDIQYLLMSALLGSNSPFKPDRWCVLQKPNKITHTVILVIEGLTSYNFMANESLFVKTKSIFEHQLEVILPKYEQNKIIQELSLVPLTQSHKERLIKEYGSLEAAIQLNKNPSHFAKSFFPIDIEANITDKELMEGETFPRTRLLLSPLQMMIEGYPMPLKGEYEDKYRDFRFTKAQYKPVSSNSPLFGLDCEMCRTKGALNELTRISIVNENYQSIYETLVRPEYEITNYLTQWSGITKSMMENVTKTLKEVQDEVCNLLPSDAILVGQSLNCDLNALKLMHPYVIDTSVIFNVTGERNRKSKLQFLTKHFLGEEIQNDTKGHSSIEDSIACLKLTKLKLSKDIYFGDLVLESKRNVIDRIIPTNSGIATEAANDNVHVKTPIYSHAMKVQKKSTIITTHKNQIDLSKFNSFNQFEILSNENSTDDKHAITHHKELTARKVVKKTREVIMENDFNISHFNVFEDLIEDNAVDNNDEEEEKDLNDDDKISKIVPKLDKWIEKIWSKVALNGLFVVIFGGRDSNTNGLSMFKIKN